MNALALMLAQETQEWVRGGWANQTVVHPGGLALLVALGVALLLLPRRYAVIPIFIMMCLAARQRITLLSLDWDFIRLMIVIGWARVLIRRETHGFRFHKLDLYITLWTIAATVGYVVQQASVSALVLRLGASIDTLGAYFLFRVLIRTWDDIRALIRGMAVTAMPIAGAFLIEKATGRNMFSVFGGVPDITRVREGRLRCQGAFAHPILAGSFWASILPLFIAMWWSAKDRALCVLSVLSAMLIIFACSSSTPVAAVMIALMGWSIFFIRGYTRYILWGIVGLLVVLQVAMQKPVYHLISRVDLVGGSTGWHRFHLIDQFVQRWDEWFLFGTRSTAHWGWGLFDVTNQYVLEGVRGGALALILFVAMIVVAFRAVSVALRNVARSQALTAMSWGIGVTMLTHSMIFLSVSYFGQIVVLLQLAFALAASASLASTARAPARRPVVARSSARRPASVRVIGGQPPRPVSANRAQERPA